MIPVGLGTKIRRAGEGQQQFSGIRITWVKIQHFATG
jgi:hypothetical protein